MSEIQRPLFEEWSPSASAGALREPAPPKPMIKRTRRPRAAKMDEAVAEQAPTAVVPPAAAEAPAAPKKRVVRRKKTDAVPDTASAPAAPPASIAEESPAVEARPVRKRAVSRKKNVEAPAATEAGPAQAPPPPLPTAPVVAVDPPAPVAAQSPQSVPAGPPPSNVSAEPQSVGQPSAGQDNQQGGEPYSRGYSARERREFRKGRRRFRNRRDRERARRGEGGDFSYDGDQTRPAYDRPPVQDIPEEGEPVFAEGVLEVSGKGFGFLRERARNYLAADSDIFVTPEVIRRHGLRDGVFVKGQLRRGSRGPQLFRLVEFEGRDPETPKTLPVFEELTVLNPLEWIPMETTPERTTTRVIDLMAPIGKGQRGLLVAPPRTGKTTLLQHIAEAVQKNHPAIRLIVLLVDERPEEVTELKRCLPSAELFASSNDSDLKSHTQIAQLAVERARRLVELGEDVFLVMDSLTRIGRAFNNAQAGGGRTMSGGVDTRALEIPRRLFASARNTEEAGSLTIIATALIETGSRMDELIFLEFKGTGNMELVLDRKISDMRIYPAVDIFQSGTRREELLLPADALQKINVIRRGLAGHKPQEAIERMLFFLRKYPTNREMLANIPA